MMTATIAIRARAAAAAFAVAALLIPLAAQAAPRGTTYRSACTNGGG